MSNPNGSSGAAANIGDAVAQGQRTFADFAAGYEKVARGLMNVAMRQLELSRELMEGAIEDLGLLAQARSPDTLLAAEMEVFRRRAERTIGAVRTVTREMGQVWSESLTSAATASGGSGDDSAHQTGNTGR
jgi:Phasin protein